MSQCTGSIILDSRLEASIPGPFLCLRQVAREQHQQFVKCLAFKDVVAAILEVIVFEPK